MKKHLFLLSLALSLTALTGCDNKIKLTAPSNIRIDNQALRWDANLLDVVPDFQITINNAEVKRVTYNPLIFGGSLPLDFITESGEFNFKIQTITNNSVTELVYRSSDVVEVSYVFTLLSQVTFVTYNLSSETLNWNQVSGALKYTVQVDGSSFETTTNSYALPRKNIGGYSVRVQALGDGVEIFNSPLSSTFVFTFLAQPLNLQRDGLTISWSPVEFASSYYIYNNLTQIGESTNTNYTLPSHLTGNLSITIKAIGNNTTYFDSLMSSPLQFTIV
jgi:hypothetical protein